MNVVTDHTDACKPSMYDVLSLAWEADVSVAAAWSWISEGQIALGVSDYAMVGRGEWQVVATKAPA